MSNGTPDLSSSTHSSPSFYPNQDKNEDATTNKTISNGFSAKKLPSSTVTSRISVDQKKTSVLSKGKRKLSGTVETMGKAQKRKTISTGSNPSVSITYTQPETTTTTADDKRANSHWLIKKISQLFSKFLKHISSKNNLTANNDKITQLFKDSNGNVVASLQAEQVGTTGLLRSEIDVKIAYLTEEKAKLESKIQRNLLPTPIVNVGNQNRSEITEKVKILREVKSDLDEVKKESWSKKRANAEESEHLAGINLLIENFFKLHEELNKENITGDANIKKVERLKGKINELHSSREWLLRITDKSGEATYEKKLLAILDKLLIDDTVPEYKGLKEKIDTLNKEIKRQVSRNRPLTHLGRYTTTASLIESPKILGAEEAKKQSVPILTNFYYETLEDRSDLAKSQKTVAIGRSAAPHDFSRGETNLLEMECYDDLSRITEDGSAFRSLPEERKKWIIALFSFPIAGNDGVIQEHAEKALEKLNKNIRDAYSDDIFKNKSVTSDDLKEARCEREERLDSLFLQELAVHLKNKPLAGASDTFAMSRIGLLNMEKKPAKKGKYPYANVEKNQALDAYVLYKRFNGATLKFDLGDDQGYKAAFRDFDDPKIIHLPRSWAQNNGYTQKPAREATLQSHFANISITGVTKNRGLQKLINDEMIDYVEKRLDALKTQLQNVRNDNPLDPKVVEGDLAEGIFEGLKTALQRGEGGEATAQLMGSLLTSFVDGLNTNCFGGNDRTGYFTSLIMFNSPHGLNAILEKQNLSPFQKSSLSRQWRGELISGDSLNAEIIARSKGANFRALKIGAGDLRKLYFHNRSDYLLNLPRFIFDICKGFALTFTAPGEAAEGRIDFAAVPIANRDNDTTVAT